MPTQTPRRRGPRPGTARRLAAGALTGLLALGLVPGASAAPAGPPDASAAPTASSHDTSLPRITPQPQSVERGGPDVPLPRRAHVVAGEDADRHAVRTVVTALRDAGVRVDRRPGLRTPRRGALTVWIGGRDARQALATMDVTGLRQLPENGYVLATGRSGGAAQAVLAGADATGTYYAAQTFRRLLDPERDRARAKLPSVTVRDWPQMEWRGVIEGFYGEPWSHRDRLRQLDFYGAHKMNTYVYAPKDDPYHREKWREPYPVDRLNRLDALDRRADARHVDFVYTLSPGLDVCHSSPDDLAALVSKAESLWRVGVRDFGVFFDDIGRELHCAEDEERFGDRPAPLAAAQAHLLNAFRETFLRPREGAGRLLTVPTEYSGTGSTVYREEFAQHVHEDVVLYWTGPQVVSPTITADDADAAAALWKHDVVLWDNYPVNDYLPRRLFLGPLTGRAGDLPEHGVVGLTANPMPQAEPSKIALGTVADYAWNPDAYDAERSWRASLHDVGGSAHEALRAFAGNSRSSDLSSTESPRLTALIEDFRAELRSGAPGEAADALVTEFTAMRDAQRDLARRMDNSAFLAQAGPWLTKLHWYGAAGAAATRSLVAQAEGDGTTAWRQRVRSTEAAEKARETYETVATGVVQPFLDEAAAASRVVTADAPAEAPAGADVRLAAQVDAGDVAVAKVEFRAGPRTVGTDTTAPYTLTWPSAPTGLHLLTARAVAEDGSTVASAPVRLTVGTPRPVLLLTGTDAPIPEGSDLSAGDAAVRDRLEYLGHPVVTGMGEDSQPSDAEGKAAVVISSTLSSGSIGTKFRDAEVPVLTWEAYVLDDMAMATGPGETFRTSALRITDAGSPLAAGLDGEVTVYRGADRIRWGTPAPGAETAAVTLADAERAALFGYREGDTMTGMTAPAPRVALFLGDSGIDPAVITDEGLALFDAAVTWALSSPGD
jgi:hypothetical protein